MEMSIYPSCWYWTVEILRYLIYDFNRNIFYLFIYFTFGVFLQKLFVATASAISITIRQSEKLPIGIRRRFILPQIRFPSNALFFFHHKTNGAIAPFFHTLSQIINIQPHTTKWPFPHSPPSSPPSPSFSSPESQMPGTYVHRSTA